MVVSSFRSFRVELYIFKTAELFLTTFLWSELVQMSQIYNKLSLCPIFSLMNLYRSIGEWCSRAQYFFSHLYSLSVERRNNQIMLHIHVTILVLQFIFGLNVDLKQKPILKIIMYICRAVLNRQFLIASVPEVISPYYFLFQNF